MLIWDIEVPSDRIDVQVFDGWVTLKGEVDSSSRATTRSRMWPG